MRTFGRSNVPGRRSVPRTRAPLIAVLSLSAGDYPVSILDVSRTGVRVQGDILPRVGQKLVFRVENVCVCGGVVRCDGGSCAIEFETPIAFSEVQKLRWLGDEISSF